MRAYSVEVSRTAEKQLARLPAEDQVRVARAMLGLAKNPRPSGVRKLSGVDDAYRIRVGRYRIIYEIYERDIRVLVLKVGDRKEVYR